MGHGVRIAPVGMAGLGVAALLVLLVASVPAAAAPKRISGKLSRSGYTVIALAADGRATSVRVKGRNFRLRPPAKRVTLHLRARNGRYAGPIVVGRKKKGRVAILGVKAGAKLGRVKLGRGYARLAKKLRKRSVDGKRVGRAKRGAPIGARRFGLVRSKPPRRPPRGDRDLDGIPNPLDIDDDGDRMLDDYDRTSGARTSAVGGTFPDGSHLDITTDLGGSGTLPEGQVNVNGGSSDVQVAAAQQEFGRLGLPWIGIDPGSGELDCGTLVYCSARGTGRFQVSGVPGAPGFDRATAPLFPECCDSDSDGLGSFTATQFPGGPTWDGGNMTLFHGATDGQISAGDVLILRGTVNGTPVESAKSVGFVFSTHAVIAAYTDGQGNSSAFSYPYTGSPAPVRVGPSGDAVVTLRVWRPQRRRIAGDPGEGEWIDVGNLIYSAEAVLAQPGAPGGPCPQSSYSALDPNLIPDQSAAGHTGPPTYGAPRFFDVRGDQPSSPQNSFSFTLNLTDCLASHGQSMSTTVPTDVVIWAFSETPGGSIYMTSSRLKFILGP
jgi:hypothetical protein